MKQKLIGLAAILFLLTACNNEKKGEADKKDSPGTDSTAENQDMKPKEPLDSAAMAKGWMDFATPGAMHQWMAGHAGTWEGEVSQWMDPAAPPVKSMASSEIKSIMNGLYLTDQFSGNMMGQPFSGQAVMGYDNVKKKFVSTWIDNMGSGIIYMEGTYDEASKTLHLAGKQSDPSTGGQTDIRQEQKWLDQDTYVLSMFGTGHDGKEAKFMEGTFKRKK